MIKRSKCAPQRYLDAVALAVVEGELRVFAGQSGVLASARPQLVSHARELGFELVGSPNRRLFRVELPFFPGRHLVDVLLELADTKREV